jgi:hypothetical protein
MWCHNTAKCSAGFLFLLASVAAQSADAQRHYASAAVSVGVVDPPLVSAYRGLHPEVEVSLPLSLFGSGRSTTIALSAGHWTAGGKQDGICSQGCPDYRYEAWTIAARVQRSIRAGRLSVQLQGGANHHFLQASDAEDGLAPRGDSGFSAGVTNVEIGAMLAAPLDEHVIVEAGPRFGLRLSQGAWGPPGSNSDWRIGVRYLFAIGPVAR